MSFTGYRAYALQFEPTRIVLSGAKQFWETAELVAQCNRTERPFAKCHESNYEGHGSGYPSHLRRSLIADGYTEEQLRGPLCGIYSFKTLYGLWDEFGGDYKPLHWDVIARVENFGDLVVETERGFRSARTRITELFYLPPPGAETAATLVVTRALAQRYEVPVSATSWHHLLADSPEYADWLGVQQVRATNHIFREVDPQASLVAEYVRLGILPPSFIGARGLTPGGGFSAQQHSFTRMYGNPGGFSWQTLASPSAPTPTSPNPLSLQSSLLSGMSRAFQNDPYVPPPNPSLPERYLDWTYGLPHPLGFAAFMAPFVGTAALITAGIAIIAAVLS